MPTVTTPRGYKLGKLDPVESPFREFKEYFAESLPAPPKSAHWGGRVTVPWGMDGNGPDPSLTIAPSGWGGCGDCVECLKVHGLLTANFDAYGHTVAEPTADAVVEQYCEAQGCTPAELFSDPTQYDGGETITTSLTNWCRDEEYGVELAFTAPVDHTSKTDLKNAIYLGGGVGVGIQLPQNAEEEFPGEWTWTPKSPILGGHGVWLCGYTGDEYVAGVSWGQLIRMTWQFVQNTIDEAHSLVFPQSVAAGKSPTGLLIPKWESDLKDLAGLKLHIVEPFPERSREPGMMWRYPPGDVDRRECWWIVLPSDDRVGTPGHVGEVSWRTTDTAKDGSGMWGVTGDAPALTVTPSIDVECWVVRDGQSVRDGSYWHGWIRDGELVVAS